MSSTCGYTCPQCEGRGFTDDGEVCDWCSDVEEKKEKIHLDEKPINDSDDILKQLFEHARKGAAQEYFEDEKSKKLKSIL